MYTKEPKGNSRKESLAISELVANYQNKNQFPGHTFLGVDKENT